LKRFGEELNANCPGILLFDAVSQVVADQKGLFNTGRAENDMDGDQTISDRHVSKQADVDEKG
jgi:hypothetical protein